MLHHAGTKLAQRVATLVQRLRRSRSRSSAAAGRQTRGLLEEIWALRGPATARAELIGVVPRATLLLARSDATLGERRCVGSVMLGVQRTWRSRSPRDAGRRVSATASATNVAPSAFPGLAQVDSPMAGQPSTRRRSHVGESTTGVATGHPVDGRGPPSIPRDGAKLQAHTSRDAADVANSRTMARRALRPGSQRRERPPVAHMSGRWFPAGIPCWGVQACASRVPAGGRVGAGRCIRAAATPATTHGHCDRRRWPAGRSSGPGRRR